MHRFFEPMFDQVAKADDARDLIVPLRNFLSSEAVNARTDDDKTLVVAVRRTSRPHSDNTL